MHLITFQIVSKTTILRQKQSIINKLHQTNMKSVFLLITFVLFVCPCFAQTLILSQAKEREFINVELVIIKEYLAHQAKVPLSENTFTKDDKYLIEGEFLAQGLATVDCIKCPLSSEFNLVAFARSLTDKLSEVNVSIDFINKRKCDVDKVFQVKHGEKSKINLKCGVTIIAYY